MSPINIHFKHLSATPENVNMNEPDRPLTEKERELLDIQQQYDQTTKALEALKLQEEELRAKQADLALTETEIKEDITSENIDRLTGELAHLNRGTEEYNAKHAELLQEICASRTQEIQNALEDAQVTISHLSTYNLRASDLSLKLECDLLSLTGQQRACRHQNLVDLAEKLARDLETAESIQDALQTALDLLRPHRR